MDTILFVALHGIALQYPFLQGIVVVCARLAIVAYPVFFLRLPAWRHAALQSLIALVIAYAINIFIAIFWYRERPYADIPAEPLFGTSYLYDSFPSDHSAAAMALAASIFFHSSRTRGILALALALSIGLARVMAGVHYVSDVLAGFGIGLIAASVSAYVLRNKI
ncbi:phosphatase PAP2 family protein [Candidatus Uhrbacteria bacterium]|nr:phosphatase PAP2 family protein [Candidatus Uhrbacteria bacterium]